MRAAANGGRFWEHERPKDDDVYEAQHVDRERRVVTPTESMTGLRPSAGIKTQIVALGKGDFDGVEMQGREVHVREV